MLDEHTAALAPKSANQVIRLTEDMVARNKLTNMMVTQTLQQTASLGDRLIMMVRGQIMCDFQDPAKTRLTSESILTKFKELCRLDRLDKPVAK